MDGSSGAQPMSALHPKVDLIRVSRMSALCQKQTFA